MARGDQIYVMRPFGVMQGIYQHHGIDCGDGSVIHYRKPTDADATISRTLLSEFSMGNRIYIKRYPTSIITEDVIARAESRLGEQNYDLFKNNCEHFATWCKTGVSHSQQLHQFGLGTSGFTPAETHQFIQQAKQSDVQQAEKLFRNALGNLAIARQRLQPDYDHALKEMQTWQRVAQLALKQGKEPAARAALYRKQDYQKKADQLKTQLDQINALEQEIIANAGR